MSTIVYDSSGNRRVTTAIAEATIYTGFVDVSNLAGSRLPTGWSVTNEATGRHRVTHNLALAAATDLTIVANARLAAGATDDRYALVTNENVNYFDILTNDVGSGAVNEDFYFIAST